MTPTVSPRWWLCILLSGLDKSVIEIEGYREREWMCTRSSLSARHHAYPVPFYLVATLWDRHWCHIPLTREAKRPREFKQVPIITCQQVTRPTTQNPSLPIANIFAISTMICSLHSGYTAYSCGIIICVHIYLPCMLLMAYFKLIF